MNDAALPAPFIVGAPRSGTTLLRLMLDSHPELAIPHETHFLHHIFAHGNPYADDRNIQWLQGLITNHWAWPSLGLTIDEFRAALERLPRFNLTEGLRTFYLSYAGKQGKPRWGDKTPDYGEILPEIEGALPEAHFIHLVRDGRDVAVSARHLWFGAGNDMLAQGRHWAERVRTARWNGRAYRHYLEVHYEALLAQPENTLRTICEFLHLTYDRSMLRFHERAEARLSEIKGWPANRIGSDDLLKLHSNVRSALRPDRIRRWKNELRETELARFESGAGCALQEFGYEPVNPGPRSQLTGSRKNQVSGLLMTADLSDRAFLHFRKIRELVDEMVVFVDADRASAKTRARAKELGTKVYETSTDAVPEIRQEMLDVCETEWVLRVDSDEELSSGWCDGSWRQLLQTTASHFFFARRWILPSGAFVNQAPWWPDWQMRLFRNAPGDVLCRGRLHLPVQVRGEGVFCRTLAIHHYTLRDLSRAEREEKVRRYDAIKPGGALGHYYLFEDFRLTEALVPPEDPIVPARELLRMQALSPEKFAAISIHIASFPEAVRAGERFWIEIALTNHGATELVSAPPHPVHVAYHWLEEETRMVVVFDSGRTAVFPSVPPGNAGQCMAMIIAPEKPGRYTLQMTLVQEAIAWFEDYGPGFIREGRVLVQPRLTTRPTPALAEY